MKGEGLKGEGEGLRKKKKKKRKKEKKKGFMVKLLRVKDEGSKGPRVRLKDKGQGLRGLRVKGACVVKGLVKGVRVRPSMDMEDGGLSSFFVVALMSFSTARALTSALASAFRTRQDKTRQDKTRQDKTRQDKIRQDMPRQDKAR